MGAIQLTPLQSAYDISPDGRVTLDATRGALKVRGNVLVDELVQLEDELGGLLWEFRRSGDVVGQGGTRRIAGGDLAGDELTLRGSLAADLGRISIGSPVTIEDVSDGDSFAIRWAPTFTTGGGFFGGLVQTAADVTYDNAVFIWTGWAESTVFRAQVGPGFAAFTGYNFAPRITNDANVDLVQALVFNAAPIHDRSTAGTSNVAQSTTISSGPQNRASVAGAVLNKTIGDNGLVHAPTFSTVAGSTVNMGTSIGIDVAPWSVALFQPQGGIENATAAYGLRMRQNTFAISGEKAALRNEMTDAANRYMLLNPGGARSDFGGGNLFNCGFVQILSNARTLSLGASGGDVQIGWDGSAEVHDPIVGDNLRIAYAAGSHTLSSSAFGSGAQLRMGFNRFAWGQTGAIGNQIGIFVAPAFTVPVAGEWSDFLLSQAGNLNLGGNAMSNIDAWRINPRSITLAGGSLTDIATLRINGMTTSGIGAAATSSLFCLGRGRFNGALSYGATAVNLGANQNNWTGMGTGNSQRNVVEVNPTIANVDITGIATQRNGDELRILNVSAVNTISLLHQSGSSLAGNRIVSPTGATYVLSPGQSAVLYKSQAQDRWYIQAGTGA